CAGTTRPVGKWWRAAIRCSRRRCRKFPRRWQATGRPAGRRATAGRPTGGGRRGMTFSLEWRSGPDQVVADVAAVTDVVAGEATDVIATAVGIGSGVNTKAGDVGTYITADHLVAGSALPIPGQCNAGSKGHAAPLSGSHVETRNFVVANVGTCAGRKHTEQITGSIDKKTGHRIVDDVGICIDAEGESFA